MLREFGKLCAIVVRVARFVPQLGALCPVQRVRAAEAGFSVISALNRQRLSLSKIMPTALMAVGSPQAPDACGKLKEYRNACSNSDGCSAVAWRLYLQRAGCACAHR